MKIAWLAPDDPRWSDILKKLPHDVYHLPQYVELCAKHEGGQPVAFIAEDRQGILFIPLLLRLLPRSLGNNQDWCDATSPYGYSSPLYSGNGDRASITCLLSAFRCEAKARKIVSVFLRLHPLLDFPVHILQKFGTLVRHGETVRVATNRSAGNLWSQMRESHRRAIRKLKQEGFRATFDDWPRWSEFKQLYWETMDRVGADPVYMFTDDYFEYLMSRLSSCIHLCTVLSPSKTMAAAGVFFRSDLCMQYHLGATSSQFLPYAPAKMMLYHACRLANSLGATQLHLGGGVGGASDSLFFFKRGFSGKLQTFATFRQIIDKDRYNTLVNHKFAFTEESSLPANNFFPAYRQ